MRCTMRHSIYRASSLYINTVITPTALAPFNVFIGPSLQAGPYTGDASCDSWAVAEFGHGQ